MNRRNRRVTSDRLHLLLYVSGISEASVQAQANLDAICKECLGSDYKLEIIDILENPRRSLDDGIIVTPTLLKLSPRPEVKIIGDLGDRERIRVTLGLIRDPSRS